MIVTLVHHIILYCIIILYLQKYYCPRFHYTFFSRRMENKTHKKPINLRDARITLLHNIILIIVYIVVQ